jgi:hypothetical protein
VSGGAAGRRGNRRRPGARTFRRTNLNWQREVFYLIPFHLSIVQLEFIYL